MGGGWVVGGWVGGLVGGGGGDDGGCGCGCGCGWWWSSCFGGGRAVLVSLSFWLSMSTLSLQSSISSLSASASIVVRIVGRIVVRIVVRFALGIGLYSASIQNLDLALDFQLVLSIARSLLFILSI